MDRVRGRQVEMGRAHPPVQTRRDPKCPPKRPRERLKRTVMRVERDIGDRQAGPPQPPGGAFEKQSPPHRGGRLVHHRAKDSEKLRSAPVRVTRQSLAVDLLVERVEDDAREPFRVRRFAHVFRLDSQCNGIDGPAPDCASQSSARPWERIRPGHPAVRGGPSGSLRDPGRPPPGRTAHPAVRRRTRHPPRPCGHRPP